MKTNKKKTKKLNELRFEKNQKSKTENEKIKNCSSKSDTSNYTSGL